MLFLSSRASFLTSAHLVWRNRNQAETIRTLRCGKPVPVRAGRMAYCTSVHTAAHFGVKPEYLLTRDAAGGGPVPRRGVRTSSPVGECDETKCRTKRDASCAVESLRRVVVRTLKHV